MGRRTAPAILLSGLVGASLALSLTGAAAAPPPGGASTRTSTVQVVCDGLGSLTLTVRRPAGGPMTATGAAGQGVTAVGRPGFTGTTAQGRPVDVAPAAPTAGGTPVRCEAPRQNGVPAATVLDPGSLPAGSSAELTSAATVSGVQSWLLVLDDDPSVAPADPSAARSAKATVLPPPPALAGELAAYLASRGGSVSVAVKPLRGAIVGYTRGLSTNETASIVKVQVMAAVMRRAQEQGRSLSSWERGRIVPMIRVSDNNATTDLWNDLGGGSGVARVNALMGLTQTTPSPTGSWGRTITTAADQTILMSHFALPSSVLSPTNQAYGLSLMRSISTSQDWGVTAGPPSGSTAVKNGWVPLSDGWHVNSIGFVSAGSQSYTIGVLTQSGSASMSTLVATIEGVSRIIWRNSAQLTRGVRGDWDGNALVDGLSLVQGSTLALHAGSGDGRMGSAVTVGGGWSSMRFVVSPGDVDRDGVSDLYAVSSTGLLYFYRGKGNRGFFPAVQVGSGWSGITALTTPSDFDGDGELDLVARTTAGTLVQYRVSGAGSVRTVRSFGRGWSGLTRLVGIADLNGDGRGDVLATTTTGAMLLYTSTGVGLASGRQIGSGWSSIRSVTAPGDVNGDGVEDLLAIGASGVLVWYAGRADGRLGSGLSTGARSSEDGNRLV